MAAAVPASPAWAQSYGYGRGYVAPRKSRLTCST